MSQRGRAQALPAQRSSVLLATRCQPDAGVRGPEFDASEPVAVGSTVVRVRAPGWAPAEASCLVEADRTTTCDVSLRRGGTVAGTITEPSGQRVRGATVSIGVPGELAFVTCTSAATGAYLLADLAPGRGVVTVSSRDFGKATKPVDVVEEQTASCDFVLDPGRVLAGRVLSLAGEPLRRVVVRVASRDSQWGMGGVTPDAEGRFRVFELPPGQFDVFVEGAAIVGKQFRRVDPAAHEIEFRVETRPARTASLSGVVVGPANEPVSGAQVSLRVDEGIERKVRVGFGSTDPSTGAFRFDRLSPDLYEVRVEAPGHARHVVSGVRLAESANTDLGVVRLEAGGRIAITDANERLAGTEIEVWTGDLEWIGDVAGSLSMPLAPGRYVVRVVGAGVAERLLPVTVEAGRTTAARIHCAAGHDCRVELDVAPRDVDVRVDIGCVPSGGVEVWKQRRVLGAGETTLVEQKCLASGSYEVVVAIGERTWRAPFAVTADPSPQVLRLRCE